MFIGLGLGLTGNYLLGGTVGAASSDGLAWANLSNGNALDAWDFLTDQARFNSVAVGPLANTPGWSFTRASTGYAATSAGVLTAFSSGALRRTDKGVLIEGARTNLCLQSQTFDDAAWTKSTATVTANAVAAPDGTTTADKLVEDTSNAQHRINQAITVSSGAAYSFSVYAKAAERLNIHMRINTATAVAAAAFNLQAGTALTPEAGTSSITALGNGWYRCTIVGTTDGTTATVRINLSSTASQTTSETYVGDGTSGAYLWGAQLEAASFPSSYIPTTTASATRAADVLTVPVSGIDYPLSFYVETQIDVLSGGTNQIYLQIDDGSGNNRAAIDGTPGAGTASRLYTVAASINTALISVGTLTAGTIRKTAARSALNDFQIAGNGTLGSADTSGAQAATPTTLRFGKENSGGTELFGYLRRAALFTRALSDAELQSLTT